LTLHFFQYRFTWEHHFFEIYSPKDVEVSSPEVYGSVSEKVARKKYGVWKTQGEVGNHPLGSSRVKNTPGRNGQLPEIRNGKRYAIKYANEP